MNDRPLHHHDVIIARMHGLKSTLCHATGVHVWETRRNGLDCNRTTRVNYTLQLILACTIGDTAKYSFSAGVAKRCLYFYCSHIE